MTTEEKYKTELAGVRQNPQLLDKYRFDKNATHSTHFDRLRLNIAIYNDFQQSDYEIVKFLFKEEIEWRQAVSDSPWDGEPSAGLDGDVDNLYFSAFILTFFKQPEAVWLFFESKFIDFDSSIGFDGEYLVSFGIQATYQYLETTDNTLKNDLLKYIGETEATCLYSQADIDEWKEHKKYYFNCYEFPVKDTANFPN